MNWPDVLERPVGISEVVLQAIQEQCGEQCGEQNCAPEAQLHRLGLDDFDLVEIVMSVEDALGRSLDEGRFTEFMTVSEFTKEVERQCLVS